MADVMEILARARAMRASDVHLVAGSPVLFRIERELQPVTREALSARLARELSFALLSEEQRLEFEHDRDLDIVISDQEHHRYRVNLSYNDGDVGAVIRLLSSAPLPLSQLKLPPIVGQLAVARKGLILVTGSTSQGKTTTLAGMLDHVNEQHRRHIVTIEDPIEYVHRNKKSIVRQREIGRDTSSFHRGLRAALRQDPDIIAIGEMRDYETIKIALTAAETGVLVMSTLHIISIDKIIERLLSYAPDGSDGHMRALLAEALLGVVHQELLPTIDGGKRVACEILVATDGVRNVLRNRGTYHLRNAITTGQRYGMQSMPAALNALRDEGVILDTVYDSVMVNYQ